MASPTVLTFDAEGRAVDFDVWVDDLQLFLQCDSRDGVSLFDHTFGVSTAPAATADSTVRSQWTTRDAVARLAVRSHLPPAERAHFGQYKTAQSLYDAVVARYSSPATAALSRLMLPYLFPDLAAFATIADLITHLRTSDARYRAALPTEFCAKNPPPMYITLYYLVTRLPDSLASVRDHFLSLCPTELTVDLLEERLAAAEKSILAVVGGAATARARGARVVEGTAGVAAEAMEEAEGVAVEVGVVPGVGALVAAVEVVGAAQEVVEAVAEVVEAAVAVVEVAAAVVLVKVHPQNQLREWYVGRGRFGGAGPCSYVLRTGGHRGGTCGLPHTAQRCFGRLTDAWRAQFPDAVELPRWGDLLRQNVAIFDLDFDAILAAMYALTDNAEGDCYLRVPPDPGIEAAALGASASAAPDTGESAAPGAGESALSDTAPIEALHTFTLDSGASCSFFRDSTTLTPLSRPVAVSLADPSGGPVLAHSSMVLPCPAAPSGSPSGLHLPSFSTNLVSGADLQDAWVDQFTPGGQRVTHYTCSWTGRHLATFTSRPGSSLYTQNTASPPVTASGQVAASSQVFAAASRSRPESAPCSCRPLSHNTLLWHHRLGHPSLPRLRGMASRTLVSGLPRSLPPLPPGPAPTCVPRVEGRQRAAPHSSTFPPTEAPLQTLHMDVWGPARVRGQGHERYFLLVVDDYSRYTTVFPLRSKGDVTKVLIDWIRAARRQLSESFGSDLPVLRLHSDRGVRCALPPGISLKPKKKKKKKKKKKYAVHQINLQPRVSLPEATPTLRWTGKVGDASVFRVWGSRAFVRDTSADKLSSRDAPGWQFYHPTLRRVLSSQDVMFDKSVSYYRLFPYRTDSLPHPPLFLALGTPPVLLGVLSLRVWGLGVLSLGVLSLGVAEPERVEPGGADHGGAELESVEPAGTASGGAEPAHAESGGALGVPSWREPLSPQQLREWYTRRCRGAAATGGAAGAAGGATGAGAAGASGGAAAAGGAAGAGAAGVDAAGAAGCTGAVRGPGGARTGGTGAAGTGGAAGVVAGDPGAEGFGAVSAVSGGAARPQPYYVALLQQVLGLPPSPGPTPPFLSPPPVPSQSQLQPASPLHASRVRTVRGGRHVSRPRPPPVPGTHSITLRPSTAPQRFPLPSPPASSLLDGPDPESDSLRAASPAFTSFLATGVTDPLLESTAASALVAELSASASVCPLSVGGECALGTDVLEDRQEEFECFATVVPHLVSMLLAPEGDPDAPDIPTPCSYAEAIEGPYSSQWQAAMDAEMDSWKC
ncbi:unnamed protein product [Closterium sp. NIES-53]